MARWQPQTQLMVNYFIIQLLDKKNCDTIDSISYLGYTIYGDT